MGSVPLLPCRRALFCRSGSLDLTTLQTYVGPRSSYSRSPPPRRKADQLPESYSASDSTVAAHFTFRVAEKRPDRNAQGDTSASRICHLGF